jgi:hypothetical protein
MAERERALAREIYTRLAPALKAQGLSWADVNVESLAAELVAAGVVSKASIVDELARADSRNRQLLPTGPNPPAGQYEPESMNSAFGAKLREALHGPSDLQVQKASQPDLRGLDFGQALRELFHPGSQQPPTLPPSQRLGKAIRALADERAMPRVHVRRW